MVVNTEAKFIYISVKGQKRKIMMSVQKGEASFLAVDLVQPGGLLFLTLPISVIKRTSDFSSNKVKMKHKFLLSRVG